MIKKAIIATVGVTLLGAFFFGRDVVSYVSTSAHMARDAVTDQIPPEFQIERARRMLKNLVPDIERNVHIIAVEQVEVEDLDRQIAKAEERLGKEQVAIKRLTTDLRTEDRIFHYASRSFTRNQVKTDLSNRFDRFRTHEATVGSLREMRDARQRTLDSARQNFENMIAKKKELEVRLENVEAKMKMLEAEQNASHYAFDNSRLSRAKSLIDYLDKRLKVAEQVLNAKGEWTVDIPVIEGPVDDDIVDQVTEYFAEKDAADALQVAAVRSE